MSMRSYNDLIGSADEPVHPRIKRWRGLKASGHTLELEVRRKWDGLTYAPARMFVSYRKSESNEPGGMDDSLWEDELHQGLVDLGVRACDQPNEVVRYTLAFKSALDTLAGRYGPDYLRTVLVEFLRDSPLFADRSPMKEVLAQVSVYPSSPKGRGEVLEAITGIIRAKASEIEQKLRYGQGSVIDIVMRALAEYVSESFQLRARQAAFGG